MDKVKRYELLDPSADLSIRRQSRLLSIPRGKFYYKPRTESQLNLYLMDLIDRQYQRTPFFGVPRMTNYLQELGYRVNHKRVMRLYKTMDTRALDPNPASNQFQLDCIGCEELEALEVRSINGKLMYQAALDIPTSRFQHPVDIAGIYTVALQSKSGRVVRKLVVE